MRPVKFLADSFCCIKLHIPASLHFNAQYCLKLWTKKEALTIFHKGDAVSICCMFALLVVIKVWSPFEIVKVLRTLLSRVHTFPGWSCYTITTLSPRGRPPPPPTSTSLFTIYIQNRHKLLQTAFSRDTLHACLKGLTHIWWDPSQTEVLLQNVLCLKVCRPCP